MLLSNSRFMSFFRKRSRGAREQATGPKVSPCLRSQVFHFVFDMASPLHLARSGKHKTVRLSCRLFVDSILRHTPRFETYSFGVLCAMMMQRP
jgi:hypothetical protein